MIRKLLLQYAAVVVFCLVGTAVFLFWYSDIYSAYTVGQCMQSLLHSLPHHLTVAGYVMALPLVLELVRLWLPVRCRGWHRPFMVWYMAVVCTLIFLAWSVNLGLYRYWGIPLDSTLLVYLDNPKEILLSMPVWVSLIALPLLALVFCAVRWLMLRLYPAQHAAASASLRRSALSSLLVLLLCGFDFLAIRGGVGTSTMNPGRAYFCSEMPLNHAAVNPFFNFLYSMSKQKAFDKQYRFMSADEALAAMQELQEATRPAQAADSLAADSCPALLRTQRPNILLIIFESFSGAACQALYPDADPAWMPSFNRLYREAIGFTRFYANSFRTDRGVAAILASYPGQPNNSVMKDQSKCEHLQYLPKRLAEHGYRLQYLMGGDVDFTNRRGFLTAGGVSDIVGDVDFPDLAKGKWGVPDHLMFNYIHDVVVRDSQSDAPFFKTFLTISSHEPFDVPYHHFSDPYINSVAYTDSCLGSFIDRLKADTSVWNNLLVIGLPDHCFGKYPADVQQHDPLRYHIPMFWTGGAIAAPRLVDVIGQQTDLSATLLGQMGIGHTDFNFSKDLMDPSVGHYAFFTFSDGLGLITDSCSYVQDNKNSGIGLQPGTHDPQGRAQRWGKAYLQTLYDDLSRR